MSLGRTPTQGDVFASTARLCEGRVAPDSVYAVLHRECHSLFPDEMFADVFTDVGRRSVPPMIVAVVMVLQRIEGLSDREAVDRFAFDVRWKYACGGLDFDHPGFVHTVLVDMRARLAASERPDRIFEATLGVARRAGLVGRRRALDSTPIYDAVATMDTVTLVRSAVRGLLRAADDVLEAELRAVLSSGDDYASAAKPVIDWDDAAEREALVDSRAKDAFALLAALHGRRLAARLSPAAALLATVAGQDLDQAGDGTFRIARRVAKDRIISTVDPQARHGHKTRHRSFDGYKGHVATDPDSEIITATAVTDANTGDAEAATDLIADILPEQATKPEQTTKPEQVPTGPDTGERVAVYGDAAYGTGELLVRLGSAGIEVKIKTQPPNAPGGHFTKDAFTIDLGVGTVTCPGNVTVAIRPTGRDRLAGLAEFGHACATCPLATACTTSKTGRTIAISPYEAELARARAHTADPGWRADSKATRPTVERKIAHLMRRRHGGRRARMRGRTKIAADFALLAAAVNLARLASLGITTSPHRDWATAAS